MRFGERRSEVLARWSAAGLILVLAALPLARLAATALAGHGRLALAVAALGAPETLRAAGHSLAVSAVATVIAALAGTALALAIGVGDLRRRGALAFCLVLPMTIPPQISAMAWQQLAGPSSALLRALALAPPPGSPNPLQSAGGIALLLGIEQVPMVMLALLASLRGVPAELVEAAAASGASPLRVLRTVVLPLALPGLVAGTALAFVSALGNFGVPAMLGIPAGYIVLPTLIYQRLAGMGPAVLGQVAVLSLLIGAIALAAMVAQHAVLKRLHVRIAGTARPAPPMVLGRWRPAVAILCWGWVALTVAAPLASLVATSLVPAFGVRLTLHSATVANFIQVLTVQDATVRAMRNSLALSATAAAALVGVGLVIGYFGVWRRSRLVQVLLPVMDLPYVVPGVVLGIAAILLFLKPLPLIGLSLYDTPWILLAAYLSRFLVLAARPIAAGYHALDPALDEAARMTGAGIFRRLRTIVLPMLAPAAVAAAILVFLAALNELTVSVLLWSSGSETLGVIVYSLEDGGDIALAAAVGTVAVAMVIVLMLAAQRLGRRLPPGAVPWCV